MTFFTPELLNDEETMRLMEARNHQSYAIIEAAKNLLKQASEIDLSNIATEVLHRYPEASVLVLLEDQPTDYKGVIFCGHLDDAEGKKLRTHLKLRNSLITSLLIPSSPTLRT